MTDTNRNRAKAKTLEAKHRAAFREVFGNPYTQPVSTLGTYQELKKAAGRIKSAKLGDETHGNYNPARPTVSDFFCDVENITTIALPDEAAVKRFTDTYLHELTTTAYTKEERRSLEEMIGRLFIAYGIVPVSKYFQVCHNDNQ